MRLAITHDFDLMQSFASCPRPDEASRTQAELATDLVVLTAQAMVPGYYPLGRIVFDSRPWGTDEDEMLSMVTFGSSGGPVSAFRMMAERNAMAAEEAIFEWKRYGHELMVIQKDSGLALDDYGAWPDDAPNVFARVGAVTDFYGFDWSV